jgi:hypothetical protein
MFGTGSWLGDQVCVQRRFRAACVRPCFG